MATDDPAGTSGGEERTLSHVPLFAGLAPSTLEALTEFTFRRTFAAGERIVEEGRTGNGLFVVLAGRVAVTKQGATGQEQVLAELGPGEPFGEMALLGEWKRSASVRALEPATCLGMDRWVFLAYLRRDPELAIRVIQFLAERLAQADQRLLQQ